MDPTRGTAGLHYQQVDVGPRVQQVLDVRAFRGDGLELVLFVVAGSKKQQTLLNLPRSMEHVTMRDLRGLACQCVEAFDCDVSKRERSRPGQLVYPADSPQTTDFMNLFAARTTIANSLHACSIGCTCRIRCGCRRNSARKRAFLTHCKIPLC